MSFLDDLKDQGESLISKVAQSSSAAISSRIDSSLGINGDTATRSAVGIITPNYADVAAQGKVGAVSAFKALGVSVPVLLAVAVGAYLIFKKR